MGAAPLKENLAAGLIRLTGWDGNQPLVDPCCGSGVLLIEAALAALEQAPGLERHFALEGCLLYTSPSPRDKRQSRMPSSA